MPKSKHRRKHKKKSKARKNRLKKGNGYSKADLQRGMLGLMAHAYLNG